MGSVGGVAVGVVGLDVELDVECVGGCCGLVVADGGGEQLPADRRAKEEAQWTAEGYTGEDYVGYCERMVAALRSRGYPSLQIECEVLPGEYHETAPPLNLSRSLRYLFDAPR